MIENKWRWWLGAIGFFIVAYSALVFGNLESRNGIPIPRIYGLVSFLAGCWIVHCLNQAKKIENEKKKIAEKEAEKADLIKPDSTQ